MSDKEVVILVGMQGSGKTHYCKNHLSGHTRVSQDEGPNRFPGVLEYYKDLLQKGVERIVIDRINPLRRQRDKFRRLAERHGYRVKIVYFDLPRNVCLERIAGRKNHPTLDMDKMHQATQHYLNILQPPTEDECDELIVIR